MTTTALGRRPLGPIRRSQRRLGLLLVSPAIAIYAVFVLFPLGGSVYFSLTDWDGVSAEVEFIGSDNLGRLVSDPEVGNALTHNLIWIVFGTLGPLLIGLSLAVMLWSNTRGVLLLRTAYFLPFVVPGVVIGVAWSWIYSPLGGWFNRLLGLAGVGSLERGWLGDSGTALGAVLGAVVWAMFGFVVVILLSALQNVDTDLIDAARLDGANSIQRTVYVVLPEIMPVFVMVAAVLLIGGFSVFDTVFVMTGGGPGNATEVLGTYAYKTAFRFNEVGYGSALALTITALSLLFTILLSWSRRRSQGNV